MKKPEFDAEELLFIEKHLDMASSIAEANIRKQSENFILMGIPDESALPEEKRREIRLLLINQIEELNASYTIMKRIRNKIEGWRKKYE